MDSLRLKTHLAGDHRMISVAVSTVVAACSEGTVQQGSSSDDEIQLVPVTRSGVPPVHNMVGPCGEGTCS